MYGRPKRREIIEGNTHVEDDVLGADENRRRGSCARVLWHDFSALHEDPVSLSVVYAISDGSGQLLGIAVR